MSFVRQSFLLIPSVSICNISLLAKIFANIIEELALTLTSLLAQQLQQGIHLTATALNDRGEFLTLSQGHADALDGDIGYLVAVAGFLDAPIHLDRRLIAVGESDFALHERAVVALRPGATDLELLARIGVEADGIGVDDIGLEKLGELLALLLARGTPIGSEDEARDRRQIEGLVEENALTALAPRSAMKPAGSVAARAGVATPAARARIMTAIRGANRKNIEIPVFGQ
jgi:hypothetical protein